MRQLPQTVLLSSGTAILGKMANILANIVARSTLLSALEEKRRQQMKKFLLHRLFFVALLRENAEAADVTAYHEQLFQRISKIHLGESPSGILLIYSHCLLHILEASSGTIYHILMDLAAVENQDSKLFNQWYATAVEVPVTLEDVTQTQTTEEVITECLTLNLKLGVYLATLKVGNKGLSDCLHTVVPELLMPAETIQYLCKAKECLSPEEFLKIYNNPLQPKMDSEYVWPTPTHMIS
ncbi:testis-expressed protein 47-like isoform X2 [Lacerta agilis]|uniref:testis-expressed protein 47-like isoform X2 n=1 Tax=Lacerta agilis TaxID=80427 RepID=UPI00141A3C34|nr:testis-expressed protein 47-like isoform X2 [Lacerta agilis]